MSANEPTADARRTALHALERLVGTWAMDGPTTSGRVRYSWFEEEAFLVQEVDLASRGEVTRGIEYIGWEAESQTLRSHYFGTFDDTGNRNTGAWQWPEGGYESNMTRIEGTAP